MSIKHTVRIVRMMSLFKSATGNISAFLTHLWPLKSILVWVPGCLRIWPHLNLFAAASHVWVWKVEVDTDLMVIQDLFACWLFGLKEADRFISLCYWITLRSIVCFITKYKIVSARGRRSLQRLGKRKWDRGRDHASRVGVVQMKFCMLKSCIPPASMSNENVCIVCDRWPDECLLIGGVRWALTTQRHTRRCGSVWASSGTSTTNCPMAVSQRPWIQMLKWSFMHLLYTSYIMPIVKISWFFFVISGKKAVKSSKYPTVFLLVSAKEVMWKLLSVYPSPK